MDASDAKGALDGLVILDLSRILAGPTATQLLGDLGATVWKVDFSGRPPFDRQLVEVPVADAASFETVLDVEMQRVWHTDFSGRPPFKRGYADIPVIDAAQLELVEASQEGVRPRPFAKPRHR